MDKQVIIIGGGVAGLSAGYWCAELGVRALVLEKGKEIGGQLLWTYNPIHNHLGVMAANGREFCELVAKQVESSAMEVRLGVEIGVIDLKNKSIELSDGTSVSAHAIVIASGVRRRKLDVPGEEEFAGKGILSSGAKEKEAVNGLDVCIAGGGDAAFENALILAEFARSVTLVHRSANFRARQEFTEKVFAHPKIKIVTGVVVSAIMGNERVEAVEIVNREDGSKSELSVQAVLIRIGIVPNTEAFKGQIALDDKSFIIVNEKCETSVDGVYAVGDVANPHSKNISTAAGMGATAANVISQKW